MQHGDRVTAVKLTWGDIERLARHWGLLSDTAIDTLINAFGEPDVRYVYPTRRNHQQQAYSVIRAQRTGLWHLRDDNDRTAAPIIRERDLRHEVAWIDSAERRWEAFFNRRAITPLRLVYEEWQDDPKQAVLAWAQFLGANATYEDIPEPPTRKIVRDNERAV
jgi:LPS sulfotransferase NodH